MGPPAFSMHQVRTRCMSGACQAHKRSMSGACHTHVRLCCNANILYAPYMRVCVLSCHVNIVKYYSLMTTLNQSPQDVRDSDPDSLPTNHQHRYFFALLSSASAYQSLFRENSMPTNDVVLPGSIPPWG